MPSATPLNKSLQKAVEVETHIRRHLRPHDARSIAAYAGLMFTDTEPVYGERYAQVIVSLNPVTNGSRSVAELIDAMRDDVMSVKGADNIAFLPLAGGPPAEKPINVKVRGDTYDEVQRATQKLRQLLTDIGGIKDISDDNTPPRKELKLTLKHDALRRAGINSTEVARILRLLVDGEVIADLQDKGEKVSLRVKAQPNQFNDIAELLRFTVPSPKGGSVPLSELVEQTRVLSLSNIKHHNFRRTITVSADLKTHENKASFWECRGNDIDYTQCDLDALTANQLLLAEWDKVKHEFPSIDLSFAGQLDDIQESLAEIGNLFIIGVGLMYLIMGTQFRSFFQPLMILTTVPMAFTGQV